MSALLTPSDAMIELTPPSAQVLRSKEFRRSIYSVILLLCVLCICATVLNHLAKMTENNAAFETLALMSRILW